MEVGSGSSRRVVRYGAMTDIGGGRGAQESPVGKAGRIVTATRGQAGPGEVELEIRGGTEVFIARSAEVLAKGSPVICVSTLGPRTVIVLPWADPKDSLLDLDRRE